MNNTAIIAACAGSTPVRDGNTRIFLDKPVLAYPIESARNSGLFNEIAVIADDQKTADIAVKYGASVYSIQSETSRQEKFIMPGIIEKVKRKYCDNDKQFEAICCMYATALLIKPDHLKNSYEFFIKQKADILFPTVRFSYPIQRGFRMSDGKIEMLHPEYYKTRSQDLEPAFYDAQQFYWIKYDSCFSGQNRYGYELDESEVQSIGVDMDWKIAELKYKLSVTHGLPA